MLPDALVPGKKYYTNIRFSDKDTVRVLVNGFGKREILLMATHAFMAGKCNFIWDTSAGEVTESMRIQVNSPQMQADPAKCFESLEFTYGELLDDLETRLAILSLGGKKKNWIVSVINCIKNWETIKTTISCVDFFNLLILAPSIEIKERYMHTQLEKIHNIKSVSTFVERQRIYGETVNELYRYFNPNKNTWVTIGTIDNKDGTEQLVMFTENPHYVQTRCGINNTIQIWGQTVVTNFSWKGVQGMTSIRADMVTVL